MNLSLAEKRLILALDAPKDAGEVGFATAGEALRAAGAPERLGLLQVSETESISYKLTPEGARFADVGLPERRAVSAIGDGLPMRELASAGLDGDEVKVAIGWLKKKGWATIEKGTLVLTNGVPEKGADELALEAFPEAPEEISRQLAERGLLTATERSTRTLELTSEGHAYRATLDPAQLESSKEVNQITPELIGRWAEMTPEERASHEIRGFDFNVEVAGKHPGKAHPLTQMMSQIRQIFWNMGFEEIAGDYVESAYWNMDALFIPQDHPAREMQDTFYLEHPKTLPVDADVLARGKQIHETGGDTGSKGWQTKFSEEVSKQALLRTHTTNTTVRYLADNPSGNHKVFGLGKVFRKETMDATHLPEFYQIEGIVTEPGANFNTLIGLCKVFFAAMGFPETRFRPAYFPYTEPSMEIDVFYNGKWMELGGCGIFRPEVTEPLGVEHPVLAWGFGLERLAMMRLGLKDIRDLYVSDVNWLKTTPLQ